MAEELHSSQSTSFYSVLYILLVLLCTQIKYFLFYQERSNITILKFLNL